MKIGPHVFAILAFSAISTNLAVAAHRGYRASARAAASHSGAETPSPPKSLAATGDQQGPSQTEQSGAAAPAPGTGGKQGDAGAPIDTSITVNQGHVIAAKGKGSALKKKPKTATLPGLTLEHEAVHTPVQAPSIGSGGSRRRNAVGAIVEHDKTFGYGNSVGRGVAVRPTDGTPQHAGRTLLLPTDKKAVLGNGRITDPNPGAVESREHELAAALKIVTANGRSINGTAMTRPGVGASTLGGPAKNLAGVLGGNSTRPRHP